MPLALGAAVLAISLLMLLAASRLASDAGPSWGKDFAVIGTLTAVVVSGLAFGLAFIVEGLMHPSLAGIRPAELGLEMLVLGAAVVGLVLWRGRMRRSAG